MNSIIEYEENGDWIKNEMDQVKFIALDKLRFLVHLEYLETFAQVLACAWNCNNPFANTLAKTLNISRKEFIAIEGDFNLFAEIILEELWAS